LCLKEMLLEVTHRLNGCNGGHSVCVWA
jgi:hypothetical protein